MEPEQVEAATAALPELMGQLTQEYKSLSEAGRVAMERAEQAIAAAQFIEMYFMRYPGIRLFIDQTIADAKRIGYVETILGRRRPLPELKSGNPQQISFGERIAVNTVIQGSAADLIKQAMINLHKPHPGNELKAYVKRQVIEHLKAGGLI